MSSWRQVARIESVAYTVAVPEIVPTIAIVHKAVFLGSFTREVDTDLDITQSRRHGRVSLAKGLIDIYRRRSYRS